MDRSFITFLSHIILVMSQSLESKETTISPITFLMEQISTIVEEDAVTRARNISVTTYPPAMSVTSIIEDAEDVITTSDTYSMETDPQSHIDVTSPHMTITTEKDSITSEYLESSEHFTSEPTVMIGKTDETYYSNATDSNEYSTIQLQNATSESMDITPEPVTTGFDQNFTSHYLRGNYSSGMETEMNSTVGDDMVTMSLDNITEVESQNDTFGSVTFYPTHAVESQNDTFGNVTFYPTQVTQNESQLFDNTTTFYDRTGSFNGTASGNVSLELTTSQLVVVNTTDKFNQTEDYVTTVAINDTQLFHTDLTTESFLNNVTRSENVTLDSWWGVGIDTTEESIHDNETSGTTEIDKISVDKDEKDTESISKQPITVYVEETKPSEKPINGEPSTKSTSKHPNPFITSTTPAWNPELFVTFVLKMDWIGFCDNMEAFQEKIAKVMQHEGQVVYEGQGHTSSENLIVETVVMMSKDQVIIMDAQEKCVADIKIIEKDKIEKSRMKREDGSIAVGVYIADLKGHYSYEQTKILADLLSNKDSKAMEDTMWADLIIDIKYHGHKPDEGLTSQGVTEEENGSRTKHLGLIIGLTIASLLLLLIFLAIPLWTMMKRKKRKMMRHSYENRHSIETLQGLGMEAIQLTGYRSLVNHWGYSNPALIVDDRDYSSNPLNFNGLTNIVKDPKYLEDEFLMLPNYIGRVSDIPPGAEDKNRYANVIPVPGTRVSLNTVRSHDESSEYINASFVRGYLCAPKGYIATQAPLENTREDFWRMVMEQKVQAILMLTALEEQGAARCVEYWPNTEGGDTKRQYGEFDVTLIRRDIRREWITSSLNVRHISGGPSLDVYHFWMTAWPPQGLPDPRTAIGFLLAARPYMEQSMGPTLVHCSPGTGRTGAILALDIQMLSYDDSKIVDILSCVCRLRQDRPGLVQTKEQYKFVYKAVLEYANAIHNISRNSSRNSSYRSVKMPL